MILVFSAKSMHLLSYNILFTTNLLEDSNMHLFNFSKWVKKSLLWNIMDYFSLNEETKEAVITGRTAEALNENGELLIPAKVVFDNVEYLVTEIGESAFDGDEDITALVVEEGVKLFVN